MSQTFARKIEEALRNDGLIVRTRFIPADDETVDDEITVTTDDGSARYPLHVQLNHRMASANLEEYDNDGLIDSVTHGKLRSRADLSGLVRDLADRIRTLEPIPAVRNQPTTPR